MQVDQSVGLITGGAGGLGAGAARMLVREGGRVVLIDLPGSRGHELVKEIGDDVALFVPTDVTQTDQVEAAVSAGLERFGRLDVCINAAGVSPAARVVHKTGKLFPLDVFASTVAINLTGAFDVARQAAGAMSKNAPGSDGERGLIINVSSIAAVEGQVGQAAYAASKGGLAALTLPLARDLAMWGIRVLGVLPGIMDTPMLAGIDESRRAALVDLHVFPKRLGTPEDFAKVVHAFMINTMLNGDMIRLDASTRLA